MPDNNSSVFLISEETMKEFQIMRLANIGYQERVKLSKNSTYNLSLADLFLPIFQAMPSQPLVTKLSINNMMKKALAHLVEQLHIH